MHEKFSGSEPSKGKDCCVNRGSSPRAAKGLVVKKAGGVGMILANGISEGEGLVGDAHLFPAFAIVNCGHLYLLKKKIVSRCHSPFYLAPNAYNIILSPTL